jgi:acyl dehydratase
VPDAVGKTYPPVTYAVGREKVREFASAVFDPDVGIDFARMVHGGQEFVWGPPVVAGDEISTELEVKDISERGGLAFFVFETRSTNQDGETVCTGTWTNIVR